MAQGGAREEPSAPESVARGSWHGTRAAGVPLGSFADRGCVRSGSVPGGRGCARRGGRRVTVEIGVGRCACGAVRVRSGRASGRRGRLCVGVSPGLAPKRRGQTADVLRETARRVWRQEVRRVRTLSVPRAAGGRLPGRPEACHPTLNFQQEGAGVASNAKSVKVWPYPRERASLVP